MGDGHLSDLLLLALGCEAAETINSNKAGTVFCFFKTMPASIGVRRDLIDAVRCLRSKGST